MEGRLPVTEGSCQYIEKAVAESRQGVAPQVGVRRNANNPHLKKK